MAIFKNRWPSTGQFWLPMHKGVPCLSQPKGQRMPTSGEAPRRQVQLRTDVVTRQTDDGTIPSSHLKVPHVLPTHSNISLNLLKLCPSPFNTAESHEERSKQKEKRLWNSTPLFKDLTSKDESWL